MGAVVQLQLDMQSSKMFIKKIASKRLRETSATKSHRLSRRIHPPYSL